MPTSTLATMQRRWLTGMTGWWLTVMAVFAAGPFPMPKDGPVPFRRDRLPLDADTLRGLSGELVVLGRSQDIETPEGRHVAAQSLALALALDPMNPSARETLESFREGNPLGKKASILPSARIRQLTSWLESEKAGAEARALAVCLRDVLAAAELPGNPPAAQEGAWRGWVPELAAYRPAEVGPQEPKPETPVTPQGPALARREGEIFAPIWVHHAELKRDVFQKVKVSMKELPPREGEPQAASFRVELQGANGAFAETGKTLTSVVGKLHEGQLPTARLGLSLGKGAFPDRPDAGLSAAAAVLIDAAISGREPAGIVIGRVDKSGKLTSPPRLADRLLALAGGDGGRLILPREAEPLLASIPVLAGQDFFLKYEVIYASNVRELVERATSKPSGAAGEATELFAEIRSKAGNPSGVGSYVANRFVRQRLAEVYQKFPDHASARLLWQQGGGEVPLKLARPVIAAEIFRSLDALTWLTVLDANETVQTRKIDQAQETCRNEIERMERYVASDDRALLDRYREVLQSIKAFAREVRERSSDTYYYYEQDKSENALRELKRAYQDYREELAKISE
jgi:hypothetical protein